MLKKMLQNMICQVAEIISPECGIMDETGLIIACSDAGKIGEILSLANEVLASGEVFIIMEGASFQKVSIKNKVEFIAFISSQDKSNAKYLSLMSINIINIKIYYDEKYNRVNLIKNIITEDVIPGDIALRAKELHITCDIYRAVFLIRTEKARDVYTYEIIESLFPNRVKDFIVVFDNENTVLVKELKSNNDSREIDRTARIIVDTLNTELMVKAFTGIGTIACDLASIARSYREARTALSIGNIFDNDSNIFKYDNLGIGRLIYELPADLCRMFIKEVFKEGSFESLDDETILTIQKFFENNLNISETSRQLYVHRNTLVYRLDKIQKITGLDIKKFDDAIIFKVSMLVKKYLGRCRGE